HTRKDISITKETYKTAEAYPNSASPRDLRVRLSAIDLKLTVPLNPVKNLNEPTVSKPFRKIL
ncbi:MAG: hypothetical protein QXK69_07335, partial [Candidatus Caldarchaeum sp.]